MSWESIVDASLVTLLRRVYAHAAYTALRLCPKPGEEEQISALCKHMCQKNAIEKGDYG